MPTWESVLNNKLRSVSMVEGGREKGEGRR